MATTAAFEGSHHAGAGDVLGRGGVIQNLGKRGHVRGIGPDNSKPQVGARGSGCAQNGQDQQIFRH